MNELQFLTSLVSVLGAHKNRPAPDQEVCKYVLIPYPTIMLLLGFSAAIIRCKSSVHSYFGCHSRNLEVIIPPGDVPKSALGKIAGRISLFRHCHSKSAGVRSGSAARVAR